MITSEINFFSESLGMRASLSILLPQRATAGQSQHKHKPKYRTLYLLHGHSDDHTAWQRWTSIERYVESMHLAVVMPSVHLSFYTDMVHGGKYWQFISEELPAIAREIFPLSGRREDNFVAGLSMGGYGAFKLALTHPDRFAAAASLSGALDISEVVKAHGEPDDEAWLAGMRNVFGNLDKVSGSKHDLFVLANKAAAGAVKPRLYMCCGTEDFLFEDNLRFRDHLAGLPFDLTFEQGSGGHTWDFWDRMIQNVLSWLDE
ncbi:MAG TPA: alpha/beta hydrolase family protein [Anaerolineales bacterium]|jgi:S-formylglutathione hydrolase FrmB